MPLDVVFVTSCRIAGFFRLVEELSIDCPSLRMGFLLVGREGLAVDNSGAGCMRCASPFTVFLFWRISPGPFLRFTQPIAFPVGLQDMNPVGQAVQQRTGAVVGLTEPVSGEFKLWPSVFFGEFGFVYSLILHH